MGLHDPRGKRTAKRHRLQSLRNQDGENEMWIIKRFKTESAQEQWIAANAGTCEIVRLFVNNGYAVEYRKLRVMLRE
jgi:hypothetical protein